MCGKRDGREQIQAEDAHNGFAVYQIAAGGQINIDIACGHNIDKVADVGDGGKADLNTFHDRYSFFICCYHYSGIGEVCQAI